MKSKLEKTTQTENTLPNGKRLLVEAALRLGATRRGLDSIGLRELAREAGLNPNTFYRHFEDIESLGLSIIQSIADQLRGPLRLLRHEVGSQDQQASITNGIINGLLGVDIARCRQVTIATIDLFFNFVDSQPEAFIIGVRELHGASPRLREAMAAAMHDFADDMADDIISLKLMPPRLSEDIIRRVAYQISMALFLMALDYINNPEQRQQIRYRAVEHILMLYAGAIVMDRLGLE